MTLYDIYTYMKLLLLNKKHISSSLKVVYMNDIAPPMKTCFLGILTPRVCNDDDGSLGKCQEASVKDPEVHDSDILHKLPYGKVLRVEDELLCGLLLRSA